MADMCLKWASENKILTAVIIAFVLAVIAAAVYGIYELAQQSLSTVPPPAANDVLQPLPTKVIDKTNEAATVTPTPPSTPRAVTPAQSAYLAETAAVAQSNIVIRAAAALPGQTAPAIGGQSQSAASLQETSSQTVRGMFSGKFNADSFLTIYQNGVLVYGATSTSWKKQQFVNFTVTSGDVLVFVVQNVGNYGGLIGEFTFNGVTYYTNTALFSSTQYIKEHAAADNNASSGTLSRMADWARAIPSMAAALPASTWAGGVKQPTLYPKSSWLWEKNSCDSCYVRFVWTAPGNLSSAAQAAHAAQQVDPLYNVYPGGLNLSAYFVANSFLFVFVNDQLMYADPSLTSRNLQTFNMTVYPGDKIDFVVQNTGELNSLNGNFTIGPTSYYTGTESSPFVNCAVVEMANLSDLAGTIPQYPLSRPTKCLCVVGDALDILPGSRSISPAISVMGYAIYSMTLEAGSSGFIGTVSPTLLTKFTQIKNQMSQWF